MAPRREERFGDMSNVLFDIRMHVAESNNQPDNLERDQIIQYRPGKITWLVPLPIFPCQLPLQASERTMGYTFLIFF